MTKLIKINLIANHIVKTVNESQKLPTRNDYNWRQCEYILAKAILNPNHDVTSRPVGAITKPQGEHISRNITKPSYIKLAQKLVNYVDKHGKLPDYIPYQTQKISNSIACYSFAKIVKYYHEHQQLPAYCNFTSKAFTKPETTNEIYEYFKDVFGSFGDTIDGALNKIAGKGYGYYYDDQYTNKETIRRMYNEKGVNCTDSSDVFWNIGKALGYEVRAVHVLCSGGDGHIRLQFKHPKHTEGEWINRDPAAVLSNGDVRSIWCSNGEILAYNPAWFLENVYK